LIHFYKRLFKIMNNIPRSVTALSAGFRQLCVSGIQLGGGSGVAPVKRPGNAYMAYVQQNLQTVKQRNPHLKHKEAIVVIGNKWNSLTDAQKEPFKKAFQTQLDAYKKEMSKLTDVQLDELDRERKEKRMLRKQKRLTRELKELMEDKPANPPMAINLYVAEAFQKINGTAKEKLVKASGTWKSLTEKERAVYEKKSQSLKDEYKKEMDVWTKKIKEDGRESEIGALKEKISALKKNL